MEEVTLCDNYGVPIVDVIIPKLKFRPDVIRWKDKVFIWNVHYTEYRECFMFVVPSDSEVSKMAADYGIKCDSAVIKKY
jgi:hypothetical protein